jgi:hypothetical protein
LISVPPQVSSTSSGCAAMARMSSFMEGPRSCGEIVAPEHGGEAGVRGSGKDFEFRSVITQAHNSA